VVLLAPHRKHLLCQMVVVFFPPVVLPEEDLDATRRGLDGIRVVSGVGIDEVDAVVDRSPAGVARIPQQLHRYVAPFYSRQKTHAAFNGLNGARAMAVRPVLHSRCYIKNAE
jgi:hypothetical protein